jgi:NifU-like protein involved in Fe-S cluster formation
MDYTVSLKNMMKVSSCADHGAAPIPQEGSFSCVKEITDISGFSHSVGTCGLKQGACKLSLNIKNGIVEEALIESIGCSAMTHSAAIAVEILPGKTLLEALNTDLVCDAINVAMREFLLAMAYGRTQTAYSKGGLDVGAGLEDLGEGMRSQVGTSYGTVLKGPRYMETTEGYIKKLALDSDNEIIGYEFVNIGRLMDLLDKGIPAEEALAKSTGTYGRYNDAVRTINPRKE